MSGSRSIWYAPGSGPSSSGYTGDDIDRNTESAVLFTWLGGAVALAVMGIVISSAFAVGARRQLRVLGLVAANGGPPSMTRAVVLWQGAWVGAGGTALGLVLGAIGLLALWPFHDRVLDHDPAGWAWAPGDLVPIVVLGIVASVAASALPARSASAGERPAGTGRTATAGTGAGPGGGRRRTGGAVGLGLLAAAIVGVRHAPARASTWNAAAVAGGLAVLAGAAIIAPVLVGAAGGAARWFRGGTALAIRSVARQRSGRARSSPASPPPPRSASRGPPPSLRDQVADGGAAGALRARRRRRGLGLGQGTRYARPGRSARRRLDRRDAGDR